MSYFLRGFLFFQKVYGEKSKSSENANSLATLAASLWKSYPVFGDLFLAHMAIKCPFSVPYFGDNETKSDIERYRYSLV